MNGAINAGMGKSGEHLLSSMAGVLGSAAAVSRLKAELSSVFWPVCQQALAKLVCRLSRNAAGCDTLARLTCETRGLRAPGQVLFALGLAADAHQFGKAISRSVSSGTVRPAAAQATRSLTSWSAVWAGAELFGSGGALIGIATGPGAIVTSSVGALVGGYVGFFASEWIARQIEPPN